MKIKSVSRLKHTVDFSSSLSAKNGVCASGAAVVGKTLRSVNAFSAVKLSANEDMIGFGGEGAGYLCVVARDKVFRYDKRLLRKAFDMDGDCDSYAGIVGRDYVYVSPSSGGMWRIDRQSALDMGLLNYVGLAYVGERVVGLDSGSAVYFGDVGSNKLQTNASYTSNIALRTPCQGLACVSNNVLYALGPTCYKLVFDADKENLQSLKIAQGLDKVVSASVAVMGDAVIFATVTGLYALKNDKVTRIFVKSGGIFEDYSKCRARVWRGKYVLTDLSGETALSYALDVDTQTCCCVLPKGLTDIVDYQGDVYAIFQDGKLYKMDKDVYSDLYYAVNDVDFNRTQAKYLRRVNIQTKYDLQLRLTSEEETRLLTVKGKRAMQSLTVYLKGHSFNIEIRANGQTELKKLEITADVYEEDKYGC